MQYWRAKKKAKQKIVGDQDPVGCGLFAGCGSDPADTN
jgi:hypothetical protein